MSNLLERICALSDDYPSVEVLSVERKETDLHINLVVTAGEDPDLPRDIVIECRDCDEATVTPRYYQDVSLAGDHPLLWHYNEPHSILSFYGQAQNPLAVVGELFERHARVAQDWIPFRRYLNFPELSGLIAGRYGMLAHGPGPLILAYDEVMQRHGFSTAHHQSDVPYEQGFSVLLFDNSFVIAQQFEAFAL